jgi:hypothetical protein
MAVAVAVAVAVPVLVGLRFRLVDDGALRRQQQPGD